MHTPQWSNESEHLLTHADCSFFSDLDVDVDYEESETKSSLTFAEEEREKKHKTDQESTNYDQKIPHKALVFPY